MISALLFDIDNTLVDRDGALRRFLTTHPVFTGNPAAIAAVLEQDASGYTDRHAFGTWLAHHHPVFSDDPERAWHQVLAGIVDNIEPDPTVTEMVRTLSRTHAIAVVSNGGPAQRRKLERAGLASLLGPLFISAEVGAAKPDPRIFQRALATLQCPPGQALFVGDHPHHDVDAAAHLGLVTCWVTHGRAYPGALQPPTWTVDHVSALPEVVPC